MSDDEGNAMELHELLIRHKAEKWDWLVGALKCGNDKDHIIKCLYRVGVLSRKNFTDGVENIRNGDDCGCGCGCHKWSATDAALVDGHCGHCDCGCN